MTAYANYTDHLVVASFHLQRIFGVGTFASCTHLNVTVEKLNHKSVNHIFFGLVTEPEPLMFDITKGMTVVGMHWRYGLPLPCWW